MNLLHPAIAYFAVALLVLAMISEALKLTTGRRFWALVAKYHIAAAAVTTFLAALTGLVDYNSSWMSEDGRSVLKAHLALGIFVFVVVLLMANYRYLLQKSLPPKFNLMYLVIGGLALGLMFGTASLGKVGVFRFGSGVNAAMLNFNQTEEYLKKLYSLDSLPPPGREDSLLALPLKPIEDTLAANYDTLATEAAASENAELPSESATDHH